MTHVCPRLFPAAAAPLPDLASTGALQLHLQTWASAPAPAGGFSLFPGRVGCPGRSSALSILALGCRRERAWGQPCCLGPRVEPLRPNCSPIASSRAPARAARAAPAVFAALPGTRPDWKECLCPPVSVYLCVCSFSEALASLSSLSVPLYLK